MLFSLSSHDAFEFVRRVMRRSIDLLKWEPLALDRYGRKQLGIYNASMLSQRCDELRGPSIRAGLRARFRANGGRILTKSVAKSAQNAPANGFR
jgi:hypothetical protein